MKIGTRTLWCTSAFVAAALFLLIPAIGSSQETSGDYLTAEEYIELARPYLHMSCETAWAEAGENADAFIEIVDKVSAVGFLNHDLDVADVYEHSPEEVEALRKEYYTEIGNLCRESPNNLLAGVIERSLLEAFMTIAPEAVED